MLVCVLTFAAGLEASRPDDAILRPIADVGIQPLLNLSSSCRGESRQALLKGSDNIVCNFPSISKLL